MELNSSLKTLVTGDKRMKLFQTKFTGIIYNNTADDCYNNL